MALQDNRYSKRPGPHGLSVITMTGRCAESDVATVEGSCTRRFELVPIPNSTGAILKSLDGSVPGIVSVEPATFGGRKYNCVKVDGYTNPFAPQQTGGPFSGKAVLQFVIVYHEVGGIA